MHDITISNTMKSMNKALSTLSYALLGLIRMKPRSGYGLVKLFRTTPMGRFSGSPGAIYPALKSLETNGLIQGEVERPDSLRPRRVYTVTATGGRQLRKWLSKPVTVEDIAFDEPEVTLRFSLMEGMLEHEEIASFLKTFADVCDEYASSMEVHLSDPEMSLHGSLALQGGIDAYRARAQWARHALRRIRSKPRRKAPRSRR